MADWQAFVSLCAGIITVVTVLEKVGIVGKMKKIDTDLDQVKETAETVESIYKSMISITQNQDQQRLALLALLRNELYRSFRDNRNLGAWTDEEAGVQTKLHNAYVAIGGNGEEAIWWKRKEEWKIVTQEEYAKLVLEKEKLLIKEN